jgi:hypothetical protein
LYARIRTLAPQAQVTDEPLSRRWLRNYLLNPDALNELDQAT